MATSNAQRALLLAVSLASSATSPPPTTPPVPGWVGPAPGAGTRWPKWQWPPTNMSRVRHATTATIHVGEQGSGTYNHGPIVTWWRRSFFVCWYNSPRDEGSQQRVLVASSADGVAWGTPSVLFPCVSAAGDGQRYGTQNEAYAQLHGGCTASLR